jgi:hypothetical protein
MKNLKGFILLSFLLMALWYYSCDDSGVTPPNLPTGEVTLSPVNLKTLNQANDGIYQLWAFFDSAAPSWVSLGRFNINGSGGIVGESGGSMAFTFGADTLRMNKLTILLVSIEAPGANNPEPGPAHLIASAINGSNFYLDSISASLTMGDGNALGLPGVILAGTIPDTGRDFFYIASPSTNNVNCSQGIWLGDDLGNNGAPHGLDLDPNGGWIYRMWILDNITGNYTSCGLFSSFYGPDNDSAGPCRGAIDTFYNAPGQDFIQSGNGCTSISNLNDLNHGVFVTLEPKARLNATQPFFITAYIQSRISGGCNMHQMGKQYASLLPHGRVRISKVR